MRTSALHLALGASLFLTSAARAGAAQDAAQTTGQQAAVRDVTDETSDGNRESRNETSADDDVAFSSLFDSAGLPMLSISAPMYLHFGNRQKLRYQGLGGGGFGGSGGGGLGGGGGADDSDGGGLDGGGVLIDPIGPPKSIPEPAAMLMLVPAVVLAIRRARHGKSYRS